MKKVNFHSYELLTLRAGRPVTRLTVHWAFPYWSGSQALAKEAATFDKKTHFEVNNAFK